MVPMAAVAMAVTAGLQLGVITDNFIHDLLAAGSPHYDGVEIGEFAGTDQHDILIQHNTIDMGNLGQTGAVNCTGDACNVFNIKINDNLLKGGSYTINLDNSHGFRVHDISMINNTILPGQFGWLRPDNGANETHSGNIDFATGLPITNPSG
jgi:hypothetical protein